METTIVKYRNGIHLNPGKKLLIVLFSLSLALGASAQRGGHFGGGYHGGGVGFYPHSYVGVGVGFGYPFYPYGGLYGPWYGYPPYYYGYGAMPSQLALQIEDIKNDYNTQIKDVKNDKSTTRKVRRDKVNQLKHDRDAAVIQARRDYFYNSRRNNNNQPQPSNGNGQQPSNGNGQQPSNGNGQQPSNGNGQQPSSGNGQQPSDNNGQKPTSGNGSSASEQPEYETSPSRANGSGTTQR